MIESAYDALDYCFANYDNFNRNNQKRLLNALKDGTLVFPNSCSPTKKVAFVKASKQHYVGMIVGKKGSNIMQMRNQTNTNVQNPQQDDEPTFRVYGESYKDLAEMALWILEQDDRLSGKDSHNGGFKTEARIWCCSKYVGLLVGPNGGTIRQIMEESGCCSIQSPPRNEKMKYFTLTGSSEEISLAFAKMDCLIKKKYYNNDQSAYFSSNKTCDCVNECERLKLCASEGKLSTTPQTHMKMPLNIPKVNTTNHLSPPTPSSPPNIIAFNSPYIQNSTDQINREQFRDLSSLQAEVRYNQGTLNKRSLPNTPSIRGSRVFSGNGITGSPSYTGIHNSSPFPALNGNSINNMHSPVQGNLLTQSPASTNKDILDLISQQNYNLNDDLVRLLLLEFQNLQLNQDSFMKTAPCGHEISNPYQSVVNPPINISSSSEMVNQFSDAYRRPRNPQMIGEDTSYDFKNLATF